MHTRTLGIPSTVIWQFAQCPEQHCKPRGRWYLKLRENTRWPAAYSAEPIVSPEKPCIFLPWNVNESGCERSMRSFSWRRETCHADGSGCHVLVTSFV